MQNNLFFFVGRLVFLIIWVHIPKELLRSISGLALQGRVGSFQCGHPGDEDTKSSDYAARREKEILM